MRARGALSDYASVLAPFPRERTWLLPALQAVQHHERWLSPEALMAAADHLRVPRSEVYGVATDYPEFRLEEPGQHLVRVCTGVSCRIRGSLELLAALERRLGVPAGTTASDGSLTLERFDCAFTCSMAPLVEVDGNYVGWADATRVAGRVADRASSGPPSATASAAGSPALDHSAVAAPRPAATPSPYPLHAGRRGLPDVEGSELPGTREDRAPRTRETVGPRARWEELRQAAEAAGSHRPQLLVALGSCGLSVGAEGTITALRAELERRRSDVEVRATACPGLCWAAPLVISRSREGASRFSPGVTPDRVGMLFDTLGAPQSKPDPAVEAFLAGQRRELMARCGLIDPEDIADAIVHGSYGTLAAALAEAQPTRVIDAVKAARLAGRGGAYFQAALKWEGARMAPGSPKYLIVNAEEGEPGIFKDRHLMEGDPHRLIEGALLAAFAAGATRVIFYVHGEAGLAASRIERALQQARAWGLLGEGLLGGNMAVEAEIRRGAGGFVLGEETALMESIEGRRAMPRVKPPFPTEAGLWDRPTVINNVETLFAVPLILERGAAWWNTLGGGHGTKCFGLSGHVARPGLIEAELGTTLRDLIERIGGGPPSGRPLKAVILGGPSGIVVPPRQLDEPLVPGGPVNPGTGGVVALDDSASVRDAVRTLLDFNARESCGKCTPCREGTARLRDMLDELAPAAPGAVEELSEVVRLASLCGLGQAAPLSLLSAIREFRGELSDVAR